MRPANALLNQRCVAGGFACCQATQTDVLQEFYETTLRALEKAKNDRLWFKTQLKLANLWFKKQEYPRMARILKDLYK